MARALTAAVAILLAVAASDAVAAATLFDPKLRFRTITTDHFLVHFHQGEDSLAARLAIVAEEVWHKLAPTLDAPPPPRTHVVLADQSELANGFATPVPYDTVVVTAVWPAGSEFIGNTGDWLRLVFTHEFTHIVHLDRSAGWARAGRRVFGRLPFVFPNVFLPQWQIEGIATYEESALTGEGRLHAGDFRVVLTEAARAGRLEPLDRVNGGLVDWPDGNAPYAYGAGFHAYLADRFGEHTLAELAEATSGRVPFTASRVFAQVYGQSLDELWREYEAGLSAAAAPATRADDVRRLTHEGFVALGPRFAPPLCAGCPTEIVYSRRTPHEFPALYRLPAAGTPAERLTTRYLGSTSAVDARTIVFDQQEIRRGVGLYSDLYAMDRRTGRIRPLTSNARLLDPDLSPDGRTLACVQDAAGRRDLVLVRLSADRAGIESITTLATGPELQFNAPRWSPDGRTIAVERHALGSPSAMALVDVASGTVRIVASDRRARFVTPAWRRDGRALVAAVDFDEGPFNLYEIATDGSTSLRELTHTTGGATWPDVSADGTRIVFVGYTPDGFDLFDMPYPRDAAASPRSPVAADTARSEPAPPPPMTSSRYDPLRSLAPTSWAPIATGDRRQLRLGAGTGGFDVLGYHAYAASATWLVTRPAGSRPPPAASPDWQIVYQYDRWQPTFWLAASSDTSFFAGPPADNGLASTATLRERQLEAGLLVPIRRVRVSQVALASVLRSDDRFTLADGIRDRTRTAARVGWAINSAHTYGYSISAERGVAIGTTAELVRAAFGSTGDATTLTADARAYLPGAGRHHVVAVRLAGGSSTGDVSTRSTFLLGGSGPDASPLDFGRGAISLLRGFGVDTFAGSHVALLNADYRWPIARPERGRGTWPLFVRTLHAAVFADAGHAWTSRFRAGDVKTSAGAELSLDLVAGYSIPLTIAAGAAWGRDGSHTVPNATTVYVRIGRAF